MYRNGVALSPNGANLTQAVPTGMDDPLFIGQYSSDNTDSPYASNYYTDGYLDDMRIYNRALSANEVAAIYYQTRDGGYGDLAAKPQRFWNIPLAAAEPEAVAATHKQIDLVEGPSSEFDVVTEVRDERRGGAGRGTFCPVGVVNTSSFGTRSDPSTQAGLDRLDIRFVRGANQGDKIKAN
ncbi:uncharacterized protein METZ01_LOCUS102161 [marine metagenome]|uniref:LamG-like jellyroll fold domain-containing protein n=1 Tax=marine metagenome TaxID=408172 RepID=A0A381WBI5_9ZZZZ